MASDKLSPNWLAWTQTQTLIKAFADDANKLRFVGGAVRDSLLGLEAGDVDAATIFTPQEVMELLKNSGIRTIPTGIKHGTITALIDGKHFEITTLRRDVSCDGRHAEVVFTDDWRKDAARRDFTMNAIYLATDGELFDYFGGVEDAHLGRVRFIGDARARISEDYLRILRFFRFHAYYGKSAPDANELAACAELAPKIKTLSGERIAHEMLKLLAAPAPFTTLGLMEKHHILEYICGFSCYIHQAIKHIENAKLRLTILLLSAQEVTPIDALEILTKKWRLSNELKNYLLILITYINDIAQDIPLAHQKQLIRKLGAEVFGSLLLLKKALNPEDDYDIMFDFARHWQIPIMPISGKDLITLGIPEGKKLGEQLHALEIAWEASNYNLSKEELLKLTLF